jgi:hypothetical protein
VRECVDPGTGQAASLYPASWQLPGPDLDRQTTSSEQVMTTGRSPP